MSRRLYVVIFLLCLGAAPALAQETVNSASVSGRVTDPQGAVVPGALVTARQTDTNVTRETVTDGEGRFRFPVSEGRTLRDRGATSKGSPTRAGC